MNRHTAKKIVVLAVVAGILVAFEILGLGQFFTLSYVKASEAKLAALYVNHRLMVIAAFMMIYILMASLSLPGAAVMTVSSGALFGLWIGTLVVSFSSAIGATLACLMSRFVFHDWVQRKFGDKLKTVNEGIEKEGTFYLFTLRLIPVFPFWLINLVMGLTKMPIRTFYWVSQVGMLAGTVVYVNAGRELAKINSLSDILSPGLILSFAVLGLFPLVAKKMMSFYISRKAGSGKRM